MTRRHLALAVALVLLAAPRVHAGDDGLPPPASKQAPAGAAAPSFETIDFHSGDAVLLLKGNGDYTVTYPGGFTSRFLSDMGLPYASDTIVSGKATPEELAAITQQFGSSDVIEGLKFSGPFSDFQVLSKTPFSVAIDRAGVKDGRPISIQDELENDGKPTTQYNLVRAATLLNGLLDRATDGFIYGRAGKAITGAVSRVADSAGDVSYLLTDASGQKYILGGAAQASDGYAMDPPIDLDSYPNSGLGKFLGQNVVVHGVLDGGSPTGALTLIPTRAIETTPASDTRPSPTPGITGALKAANESR